MKNLFLVFGFGLSFFLEGCSSTYCDNSFPADMDAFIPDLRGRTFVYTNQGNDSISLYEYDYFVQADEVLEACSKCSCEGPGKVLYFKLSPMIGASDKVDVTCYSSEGKSWEFCITGFHGGFYRGMNVRFDDQGHFIQRDFGDTIVLKQYSPLTDTAIWVSGYGLTRIGDYHLVSVTDSTGAVLYSVEAQ